MITNQFIKLKNLKLVVEICDTLQQTNDSFHCFYCLWSYLQKQNGFDQIVPGFKSWMLQIRSLDQPNTTKTVETCLPPIASKVTDFETMQQYLSYFQKLANDVGTLYVNVVLDVEAAMNALGTVWNYSEEYKNVIIHLGTFHFLKENFQVSLFV